MTGKIALVTGASRGIGNAIAARLVKEGYKVIGTSTSDAGAAAIIAVGAKHVVLNVNANLSEIEQKLSEISDIYQGNPEILVNNAGITNDKLLMRMDEESWESVISTNLTSIYKLSKLCVTNMRKQRYGRIINIGSIIGSIGNPGQCNYAAAKAGLEGFSKSLARELAKSGITVNVVAPGFIETDMTKAMTEEQIKKLCEPIPMKRTGMPADVAALVSFIASDDAAYITGQTLHVNGGLFMN